MSRHHRKATRRPAAHNSLGSALFELGRTEEALAEFEAALRLGPGLPAVRRNVELARARLQAPAKPSPSPPPLRPGA